MRTFPLWGFDDGRLLAITRGETQEQAWEHVKNNKWERGVTVSFLSYLPLNAASIYSQNHAPGWLHRPMYWLARKEERERFANAPKTVEEAIAGIKAKLQLRRT